MLESNQQAAACFERHGATACTDVTGFGVIGHLLEMVRPSETQVRLELSRVPLLDGALECAATGIHSSLYPKNLQASAQVLLDSELAQAPALALLYDPQTAGGLLAGVPEERAEACCAELRASGAVDAAIIGCVEPRDSGSSLLHVAP
jgi:selenide,water dikinase